MTEKELNLSEHIENALNIYGNLENARNNNSTGCYIMTSRSEFIHISFVKEFIRLLKNDLKTLDLTEHSFDDIIDKRAGEKLI